MNLSKAFIQGAKIISGKTSFVLKKKAPDLFIFGGMGFVATSMVMTGFGTVKAVEAKKDFDEEKEKIESENIPVEEKAKKLTKAGRTCAWKMFKAFAPAVTFMVAGQTCIFVGRGMWKKRYAGASLLAAAYNETLEKYRERWREKVGEEEEREVFEDVQKTVVYEDNGKGKTKKTEVKTPAGSGHPLEFIFDERNLKYKKYAGNNYYVLMQIRRQCNNILNVKGYLMLSEVLELLGMPVPSYAFLVGWIKDPQNREKILFGMEGDDELRYATNQVILLKFNCDGNIIDQITAIEEEQYGYRCDIA